MNRPRPPLRHRDRHALRRAACTFEARCNLLQARTEYPSPELPQQFRMRALLDEQRAHQLHCETAAGELEMRDQVMPRVAGVDLRHAVVEVVPAYRNDLELTDMLEKA